MFEAKEGWGYAGNLDDLKEALDDLTSKWINVNKGHFSYWPNEPTNRTKGFSIKGTSLEKILHKYNIQNKPIFFIYAMPWEAAYEVGRLIIDKNRYVTLMYHYLAGNLEQCRTKIKKPLEKLGLLKKMSK